jgi:hypothetical protein
MKGQHELVQSVCDRCRMPLMKRKRDTHIICATCPGVHRKAKCIAKQKRRGMEEEAERHEKKCNHHNVACTCMEERACNTVVSGISRGDDDGSAVVSVTDPLIFLKETNHLNALEEGLRGSNSSISLIELDGMKESCRDTYCMHKGLTSNENLEMISQTTTNHHQQIDYWVRHSSSQLNDPHLSNPPSFHSHHSDNVHPRNSTSIVHNVAMKPSVSDLQQCSVSEVCNGYSSDDPSTNGPQFSPPPSELQYPSMNQTFEQQHQRSRDMSHGSIVELSVCQQSNKPIPPCRSSSDESSTRCPRFSPSYEVLYRLEDEVGVAKESELGQPHHHIINTMDQDSVLKVSECQTSICREISSLPDIDGTSCQVKHNQTIADVPCLAQSDPHDGIGTLSDESSTRCPKNIPSNEMIWKFERQDIRIHPINKLRQNSTIQYVPIQSNKECTSNTGTIPNEHEKRNHSIWNSRTMGRQNINMFRVHDCPGSRDNSNQQQNRDDKESSSQVSQCRWSRQRMTMANLNSLNVCDLSVSGDVSSTPETNKQSNSRLFESHAPSQGRQCNHHYQTSDDSEASSDVSQIEHRDIKFIPTIRSDTDDGCRSSQNGRVSQDQYTYDSRLMSNEYEKSYHSMKNARTDRWQADSVPGQKHHGRRCHSNQASDDSEASSEVSQIQHVPSNVHLRRSEPSQHSRVIEYHKTASNVDIGARIARLATSLRNLEHKLPLEQSSIFPILPMPDETNSVPLGARLCQPGQASHDIDYISETDNPTTKCSERINSLAETNGSNNEFIQDLLRKETHKRVAYSPNPISFWPGVDYGSVRIPISPIAIGKKENRIRDGVSENFFFMPRFQESTQVQCDRSIMNEPRLDPPGRRIENLVSRDSPGSYFRPMSRILKNTSKSTRSKEVAPETLVRPMMQQHSKKVSRLASTSRNIVTPKSKGRKSSFVSTNEADENDSPLATVKSWGESSVEKLIKQIDEIEDDFISVVASLPGSKDGTSVSLTSSHNSLKSANAHSLVEITLNNADSFESNASAVSLITDAVHRMRRIKDCIYQNDSTDEIGGSDEGSFNSRGGMSELLQDLTNAAERLHDWDE